MRGPRRDVYIYMSADLLADKGITLPKLAQAVTLGLLITSLVGYLGLWITDERTPPHVVSC